MEHLESLPPSFRMALIEKMKTESPFWELLGMEPIDVKKGWVKVRLPFARKLVHPLGPMEAPFFPQRIQPLPGR
jgi:acyl-coenzyme A thioesterase PaaI-like protein